MYPEHQHSRDGRIRERDALLDHIQTAFLTDDRVAALWLTGSLGRGAGDSLSDLDLRLAIWDEALPDVRAGLFSFASRVGLPLLVMEAPYNGPPGGTFFHALYEVGITGAQEVDFSLERLSTARTRPETRLLFARQPIPASEEPPPLGNPEPTRGRLEGAIQHCRFFWVMVLVCAKYAYRNPTEVRIGFLPYLLQSLQGAREFSDDTPLLVPEDTFPPHPTLATKLRVLNQLQETMTQIMGPLRSEAEATGASWELSPDLPEAVTRHLNFLATFAEPDGGREDAP